MPQLVVMAPVAGTVVRMRDVPDPVFAEEMVGPGLAVDPGPAATSTAVAPCDGTVVTLHAHAYVVVDTAGRGVLVHLGIDTVRLRGRGFTLHVGAGDAVVAGARLISWSPRDVSDDGRSAVVPVVALDTAPSAVEALVRPGDQVTVGAPLLRLR